MKYNGVFRPGNWAPLGPVSGLNSSDTSSKSRGFVCIVNGRYTMLFACLIPPGASNGGWRAISFDDNGTTCTYQSIDFVDGLHTSNYVQNVVQAGNIFEVIGPGFNIQFTIPETYSPGATIIVPSGSFIPQSPCGGGTIGSQIFIPDPGLVAVEFVDSFPTNYNLWVSFYSGNELVAGGYIGNPAQGTDPFNQVNSTAPPNAEVPLIIKNNAYIISTAGNIVYSGQFVGATTINLNGSPGALVCGGSGNNTVFVSSNTTFNFKLIDFGAPQMDQTTCIPNACSDVPGTYALCCVRSLIGVGTNVLYNAYVYLEVLGPNFGTVATRWGFGAIFSRGKIYQSVDVGANPGTQFQVYSADMDFQPFDPPPVVTFSQFDNLGNYHRPISPQGKYYA